MGVAGSKTPKALTEEGRLAGAKFDEMELHVISLTYKDLAGLSKGEKGVASIDKATFLQNFPVPGLVGDRLFHALDSNKSGRISFDDFVVGLSVCCRGSLEERMRLLFGVYDMNEDGLIGRDELLLMLNQVPRTLLTLGSNNPIDDGTEGPTPFDWKTLTVSAESKSRDAPAPTPSSSGSNIPGLVTPLRVRSSTAGGSSSDLVDTFGRVDGVHPSQRRLRGRSPASQHHGRGGRGGAPAAGEGRPSSMFTNERVADQALKDFGNGDGEPLTFEQFQRWAQSTPAVQALLQGAFPSDAHFSLATSPSARRSTCESLSTLLDSPRHARTGSGVGFGTPNASRESKSAATAISAVAAWSASASVARPAATSAAAAAAQRARRNGTLARQMSLAGEPAYLFRTPEQLTVGSRTPSRTLSRNTSYDNLLRSPLVGRGVVVGGAPSVAAGSPARSSYAGSSTASVEAGVGGGSSESASSRRKVWKWGESMEDDSSRSEGGSGGVTPHHSASAGVWREKEKDREIPPTPRTGGRSSRRGPPTMRSSSVPRGGGRSRHGVIPEIPPTSGHASNGANSNRRRRSGSGSSSSSGGGGGAGAGSGGGGVGAGGGGAGAGGGGPISGAGGSGGAGASGPVSGLANAAVGGVDGGGGDGDGDVDDLLKAATASTAAKAATATAASRAATAATAATAASAAGGLQRPKLALGISPGTGLSASRGEARPPHLSTPSRSRVGTSTPPGTADVTRKARKLAMMAAAAETVAVTNPGSEGVQPGTVDLLALANAAAAGEKPSAKQPRKGLMRYLSYDGGSSLTNRTSSGSAGGGNSGGGGGGGGGGRFPASNPGRRLMRIASQGGRSFGQGGESSAGSAARPANANTNASADASTSTSATPTSSTSRIKTALRRSLSLSVGDRKKRGQSTLNGEGRLGSGLPSHREGQEEGSSAGAMEGAGSRDTATASSSFSSSTARERARQVIAASSPVWKQGEKGRALLNGPQLDTDRAGDGRGHDIIPPRGGVGGDFRGDCSGRSIASSGSREVGVSGTRSGPVPPPMPATIVLPSADVSLGLPHPNLSPLLKSDGNSFSLEAPGTQEQQEEEEEAAAAQASAGAEAVVRDCLYNSHGMVALDGYLWKPGSMRLLRRWMMLVDNTLYYFVKPGDKKPKGVLSLPGCIAEAVDDDNPQAVDDPAVKDSRKNRTPNGYHGLRLFRPNNHGKGNTSRLFFAKSAQERDEWVAELRVASRVVPLEDNFELKGLLRKGAFAAVHRCVRKGTNEDYAVKIIDKTSLSTHEKFLLRGEIGALKLVCHPNVVRLEAVHEDPRSIAIVMTLCRGGDLWDKVRSQKTRCFNVKQARTVMRPLCEAVLYLHTLGILHRDIKPENILLVDDGAGNLGGVTLSDFGFSHQVSPKSRLACGKQLMGTPSYMAPESILHGMYGKEVDWFSCGCVLYMMLMGRAPFAGNTPSEIFRNTCHGRLGLGRGGASLWDRLPTSARELIVGLMQLDHNLRFTGEQAMSHRWLVMDDDDDDDEEVGGGGGGGHRGQRRGRASLSSRSGSMEHWQQHQQHQQHQQQQRHRMVSQERGREGRRSRQESGSRSGSGSRSRGDSERRAHHLHQG